MKGIVFTEFLEMVEDQFGLETADAVITAADVPSGGAYTAVGTYDHQEIVALVRELSKSTNVATPDLLRAFGRYLFGRFVACYPQMFVGIGSAFDFLSHVENYVHVEVRKLYPDAELPRFECPVHTRDRLELIYHSSRPFADFAEGLMLGCVAHYQENIHIERRPCADAASGNTHFVLTRIQEAAA